jgi:cytochrome d ubiquinol oxidase subunit II
VFLQALPLVFVLAGLALYVALGGADFGAGFWQLFAGRGGRAEPIREQAHHSMGPVWEANHVWLIFVLTVFWTAYPSAFGSIASTLVLPLFIALLGIIFRGATYALKAGAASERESALIDTTFSLSSILTPFALGAAIGGIATNRVPVGNATGHLFTSWLNPTSIFIGVLAVASCAYLAAVYLAADAAHDDHRELEADFRRRALGAGVAAGAIAIAGIFIVNAEDHRVFHSLLSGRALPAVIVSAAAGTATLALVYRRHFEPARYLAALAVAAIIAGWALSRWPTILPGLTVEEAAAGHDTLVAVVVSVLAGGAILFPSLALLFQISLTGRFRARESDELSKSQPGPPGPGIATLARWAIALLIAGFGLLNVAEAPWAHAVGVACLLGFVASGFRAVTRAALDESGQSGRTEPPARLRPPGEITGN